MKTVLVYVITCWQDPYPKLTQASLETWDAVNVEGVETRFYCGLPKHFDQEKVLQLPVPEGLLNMGRKDLAATDTPWTTCRGITWLASTCRATFASGNCWNGAKVFRRRMSFRESATFARTS